MSLADRPYGPVGRGAGIPPVSLNTQATASGQQTPTLPIELVLTGTTETIILGGPVPQIPLSCAIPPATGLEQTPFDVWASGYIKTTAAGTVTLNLYEGTSTTIASNIKLGTSGAVTQNTTTAPWYLHARCIYDSVSGLLTGTVEAYVNKTLVATATFLNFPTGINNEDSPVVAFSLSATSSGATAGTPTTINVQKFSCG